MVTAMAAMAPRKLCCAVLCMYIYAHAYVYIYIFNICVNMFMVFSDIGVLLSG